MLFALARWGVANSATGLGPDALDGVQRRSSIGSYQDIFVKAMADHGVQYAGILPDSSSDHLGGKQRSQEDDEEPELHERFLIKGLMIRPSISNDDNNNNNITHDVWVNRYSNGGIVLHLPAPDQLLNDNSSSTITRRTAAPGFKISYATRSQSYLTNAHQKQMASAIAEYWRRLAVDDGISEFMGFEKTGSTANFNFRIIPESRSFGGNYEDRDYCGPIEVSPRSLGIKREDTTDSHLTIVEFEKYDET
ncbi:hypothetical protein VTN00DRAFT_7616 [Thermoascus crustaceus]|uniref:uncharacterized protein n=1 Tax=Thermoascus crustaceus TaxID=5088 RepID=UPI0037447783